MVKKNKEVGAIGIPETTVPSPKEAGFSKKEVKERKKGKVSRIMLWPSRKINLGNYNTADLNAGIEIVFDKAVALDSIELKEGFTAARKVIREEFIEQYKPYLNMKKEDK